MFLFSLILVVIILCQWLAWRFRLPAIVLLTAAGLVLGPLTGFLHPEAMLGSYWPILISLSVGVILFDGGLNLNFSELVSTRRAVLQLIWLGAPLGAVLNTLAGHYIAGLTWQTAAILGCILVVTGPTVILPLLRQARLAARVSSMLKWEGIFNDPTGVLLAVLVFEYLTEQHTSGLSDYLIKGSGLVFIFFGSWAVTKGIIWAFIHGYVPEYLKPASVLAAVIAIFTVAGSVHEEGGLIAVTVMGVTMANSRMPSLEDIRTFKEVISLLLVSLIFILITATLTVNTVSYLGLRDMFFVLSLLFVARPVTVWVGTLGTGLTLKEKLLISWIAPRGVVCAVISGYLGQKLMSQGISDGDRLVPLAFSTVFATMIAHGFTLRPLGQKLGLAAPRSGGLLIVGSYPWVIELAKLIAEKDILVKVVDHNWQRLKLARNAKLQNYYGNLLLQHHHNLDLHEYTHLLAATDDYAFNGLLCAKLRHEFERNNVYQITGDSDEEGPHMLLPHLFGQPFLVGLDSDTIEKRIEDGWTFKSAKLSENFTFEQYKTEHGNIAPALYIDAAGNFKMIVQQEILKNLKDITLISLIEPKQNIQKQEIPAESPLEVLQAAEASL